MQASRQSFRSSLNEIVGRHIGHTCTGAVVHVEDFSGTVVSVAQGVLDPELDARPVRAETPFDLASITKIFTATAVLRLAAAGDIRLDAAVASYLERFRGEGKDRVKLEQLLTHTSGLPAMTRLYGEGAPSDPWDAILNVGLMAPPGKAVVYSDIGFMTLGRIVEKVTGQALARALNELVIDPLDLHTVSYGPVPYAPATEFDSWRGKRIQGRFTTRIALLWPERRATPDFSARLQMLPPSRGSTLPPPLTFCRRNCGREPQAIKLRRQGSVAAWDGCFGRPAPTHQSGDYRRKPLGTTALRARPCGPTREMA